MAVRDCVDCRSRREDERMNVELNELKERAAAVEGRLEALGRHL
jgi:hypothetical protein